MKHNRNMSFNIGISALVACLIKGNCWLDVALLSCLILAPSAQAASFDCGKAVTKVERMICANADLSKYDDKLAFIYDKALKRLPDPVAVKREQRTWLKARSLCDELTCIRDSYVRRISNLESQFEQIGTDWFEVYGDMPEGLELYTLVMSKDDDLCNYMLQLFNEDLKKYGWRGDEHQEEHEEFKRVPWQPARFSSNINGHIEYTGVEGALFDFNNDGLQDFVVRWKASLSNARADLVLMFDSETAKRKTELVSSEFWDAKNHIDLAGWWYTLSSPFDSIAGVQVLEPFIYHETSYLVMRPLFEELRTKTGHAVIAKYGGGKFVNRETTGKMEDICYYKRIGAIRIEN